ncbi:ankyrin repeat domain-containing protein [Peribacillus sp. SCS-155]|uniref:ankyrin repeat domain-containing protein n=1 Tax=Peribacillus sedimenti TaxID=3115297 RepID=UPI003905EBF1
MKRKNILTILVIAIIVAGAAASFFLIDAKSSSSKEDEQGLVKAIQSGDMAYVEEYISDDQDLNFETEDHVTPLDFALQYQQFKIAGMLINKGAVFSKHDPSPFLVRLAYSLNASQQQDININDSKQKMIESAVERHKSSLHKTNGDGNTALHIAALKGDTKFVDILLDKGLSPSKKNKFGETSANIAVHEGHTDIALALIKQDRKTGEIADAEGDTLLLTAVRNNRPELIIKLFPYVKGTLNHQNQRGKTALMYAGEEGLTEIVQFLLQNGADKKIRSKENMTAYDYALKWKHEAAMKLLK